MTTFALVLGFVNRWDVWSSTLSGWVKVLLGVVGMVKWHNVLVDCNYRQLQRILTYHKLLMAFTLPRLKLDPGQMEVYMKPPRPPANPFVKGPPQGDTAVALEVVPIRAPGTSRELVRRLLDARDEAQEALSGYLREGTGEAEGEALVELLVGKGAVVL